MGGAITAFSDSAQLYGVNAKQRQEIVNLIKRIEPDFDETKHHSIETIDGFVVVTDFNKKSSGIFRSAYFNANFGGWLHETGEFRSHPKWSNDTRR